MKHLRQCLNLSNQHVVHRLKQTLYTFYRRHSFIIRYILPPLLVILVLCLQVYNYYSDKHKDQFSNVTIRPIPHSITGRDDSNPPPDWLDPWFCDVKCTPDKPCEYRDEVDFRIIVMTYQRPESLKQCLDSILALHTLGDRVSVEVWVDRAKNGSVSKETVSIANLFKQQWSRDNSKGRACVHVRSENAYINRQWLNTWRPKPNTKERSLILEDDVSISPLSYKWLKVTHEYFKDDSRIAGYTLQMQEINFMSHFRRCLKAEAQYNIFLYPVMGTWGYSPKPSSWRQYQDWIHSVRPHMDISTDLITPHVPRIVPNQWYNVFLYKNYQESMHEMWHIKFSHDYHLYTVYSNLVEVTGRNDVYLSINRMEEGLHFNGEKTVAIDEQTTYKLMTQWDDKYVDYPTDKSKLKLMNYDGTDCTNACCFSTMCSGLMGTLVDNVYWWVYEKFYLIAKVKRFITGKVC